MADRSDWIKRAETGPLGYVLSGGGARGMFQAGVLDVLMKDARFGAPKVLSGTSAGAINAALLAAGRSVSDLRAFWEASAADEPITPHTPLYEDLFARLEAIVRDEGPELVKKRGLLRTLHGLAFDRRRVAGALLAAAAERLLKERFSKLIAAVNGVRDANLFDTAALRKRLVKELGGETFRTANGVVLAVSVVDAHAGAVRRYITAETDYTREDPTEYRYTPEMPVDVILASASIPVLLPAVPLTWKEETSLYWDGGLLVNTPLRPVVDLEAERVVTVLCTIGARTAKPSFDNLNHALERLADTFFENTYNVDRKLLHKRNELSEREGALEATNTHPKNRPVLLYKAVRPLFGEVRSYLDFTPDAATHMFAAGRTAAAEWLAGGPAHEGELEHQPPHPYGD